MSLFFCFFLIYAFSRLFDAFYLRRPSVNFCVSPMQTHVNKFDYVFYFASPFLAFLFWCIFVFYFLWLFFFSSSFAQMFLFKSHIMQSKHTFVYNSCLNYLQVPGTRTRPRARVTRPRSCSATWACVTTSCCGATWSQTAPTGATSRAAAVRPVIPCSIVWNGAFCFVGTNFVFDVEGCRPVAFRILALSSKFFTVS